MNRQSRFPIPASERCQHGEAAFEYIVLNFFTKSGLYYAQAVSHFVGDYMSALSPYTDEPLVTDFAQRMDMLPMDKMPEAEVSLRIAFFLIEQRRTASVVRVAIDGAQIKTEQVIHFPIIEFLNSNGWKKNSGENTWQGIYVHQQWQPHIQIHSFPGQGDIVATLHSGQILRVESKKGPLIKSKSSQEYPLIREALGQLLTIEKVGDKDILAVAIPYSDRFAALAKRWREAPLIQKFGIRILTVDRKNKVDGFE